MTLIGRVVVEGTPFLFGDLLTSSREGRVLHLPTVGRIDPTAPHAFGQPGGMCQKVVLIGRSCALAWAGSVVAARTMVRELREIDARGGLSFDELETYLTRLGESSDELNQTLCILGLHHDGTNCKALTHRASRIDIHGFDSVHLAGSGVNHSFATDTDDVVRAVHEALANVGAATANLTGKGFGAQALLLQSQLMCAEIVDQSTLDYLYGGGYEVAYFDSQEGRFVKFDDPLMAYSVCHLEHEHDAEQVFVEVPFRYTRMIYLDRRLLVLNMEPHAKEGRLEASYEGFVVDDVETLSMDAPRIPTDLLDVFAGRQWICWNLIVIFRGRLVRILPFVSYSPTGSHECFVSQRSDSVFYFAPTQRWIDEVMPMLLGLRAELRRSEVGHVR